MPAKFIEIFQTNRKYTASVDHGPRFPIGSRVTYQGMVGITNDGAGSGVKYDPANYAAEGHWAPFILPTAVCESSAFMTNVNTYDSARFTFGFFQFAAHVPDGDFVRFFRRLLGLPSGPDYFPDLVVQGGRIFRETQSAPKQLESATSTTGLMDYLNPSSSGVEDIEVINAAKLIDGANQFSDQRTLQADEAINTAKQIMKVSGTRYALDGMIDTVCLVIMDIRHQGRAGSQAIISALSAGSTEQTKLSNLLKIGAARFPERIKTLKGEMQKLTTAGTLGTKRYQLSTNSFA
ncbi:MAG TPA: hypothetical protein VK581_06200 [Chthoniobacterales bacterium]|nr:hypothetical protein [Chthoniobacterales bacterium]